MSQGGYAIELYLDPALENQVLKAWNVLARRQISSQLIEIESRPHITLYSAPFIDPTKLESIIKTFASKQEPLPLSLSTIGCHNNLLFLAPTPTLSLLQFHSQLGDAMRREGIEISEDYRPENWIPYCAVAQDVPKARMAESLCVLRDLKLPVAGYAMDIGLVEFSPVREFFSFVLGNTVEG
jgi:2'-5' RNA ligase